VCYRALQEIFDWLILYNWQNSLTLAQTDPPASPELATCLSCSARPIARYRVTDRQDRHWRAGHQCSMPKKSCLYWYI